MSLVVRVIAPTGRDAELIVQVLQANGVSAEIRVGSRGLLEQAGDKPIGPLLITEEALSAPFIEGLADLLRHQPAWSDLPLLIVTRSGRENAHTRQLEQTFLSLGSPVLLERPIRTSTLVSSVRAALRSRQRQYEIRDTLRERDSALVELKHERELLQTVLDNVPVGVVLARSSGEIILANHSVERILRHPILPTKDIEAHGTWISFHPDGRQVTGPEYPLPRAIATGTTVPPEDYLYQRGDGTQGWVSLAASPIFDEDGRVSGAVAAILDIDRQKQAEAALIRTEKLAAVGRLAASISHEINNPLEAVTNLLYLAREHPGLPTPIAEYLHLADQELGRVSQIVMQTLRFHRQSTSPRPITPEALLEPSVALYRGRMLNSHVELELQHRPAGTVVCYEGDIRQICNNLIGNAIDAMRMGGRILVRTSRSRIWKTGMPAVRISVADNGHGMEAETIRHIFEPFYTTKGMNGTGLGLWISRGIAEKHHGLLQVRSSQQPQRRGTVFSIVLPAEPISPEMAPEPVI